MKGIHGPTVYEYSSIVVNPDVPQGIWIFDKSPSVKGIRGSTAYEYSSIVVNPDALRNIWINRGMITLQACTHVTITGNQIGVDVLGKNITLVDTPVKEVRVEGAPLTIAHGQ